jgi:hypothetical protein
MPDFTAGDNLPKMLNQNAMVQHLFLCRRETGLFPGNLV